MIITKEIESAIKATAFIPLVTMNADGTPHPIIAGRGEVSGDTIVFGIYKMEQTQKNLSANKSAWAMAATMDGKPVGYRLSGTAEADGKHLSFHVARVEQLI